jgi:pimeloyl-ACP methyl ester carboxylesterase
VQRQFRFAMTGDHEIDGQWQHLDPDPYGAWVFGGNYLTAVPGLEGAGDVAGALLELAREAGRLRRFAGDPVFDPLKRELRERIAPARRELFDTGAPLTDTPLAVEPARELADALASAVVRVDPLIDPQPFLPRATVPTMIAHGRDDRLVAWTESVRLARGLPPGVVRGCTITALFEHSGGTSHGLGPVGLAREGWRFAGVLRRILRLI